MIRVCDFIADFIYNEGIGHVFLVTGGGMMYLSDGIASQRRIKAISTHHEQAAAMAAVSYAKYNDNIGVAYLTSGCGGTNAMTGVLQAWQDNIPCLFISGQIMKNQTIRNSGLPLRQVGVQESDIVGIVNTITKYSVMINEPNEIKYHLQKAVYLARNGRKGPVWLDIPLDVQSAYINESELKTFCVDEHYPKNSPKQRDLSFLQKAIAESSRPIIVAGQGIRLAGAIKDFKIFIEKTRIPYVTSHLGIDLLPYNHPLFIGRIGTKGDRVGNMTVYNSDLVLVIGSRLSISSTGYDFDKFAPNAKVIVVDIDIIEHKKVGVKIDYFIHCDAKLFLDKMSASTPAVCSKEWADQCSKWKENNPVYTQEFENNKNGVNTYAFINTLCKNLKDDSVIISDAGTAWVVTAQAAQLIKKQRHITSGAQAEMGYTLPATIGVCFSKGEGEVIGITGDGSFQMNIQELQTIIHHNLPIKLFIWNNNGYSSIRTTQAEFCEGRFIGIDKKHGVSFPNTKKIADAYGIRYLSISEQSGMETVIKQALSLNEPVICEVFCQKDQKIVIPL